MTQELAAVPPELRPGVQALSFHVMRWLGAASSLRDQLVKRQPPAELDALLLSALALLWPPSSPPYAAHTLVDQAVAAARRLSPGASGFLNAVLRRFLRETADCVDKAAADPRAQWNHPIWWMDRLRTDWPDQADAILRASEQHPPMMLRVNVRHTTVQAYRDRLAQVGKGSTAAAPGQGLDQLLVLAEPCPVQQLPGFEDGDVSVQDSHAQLAAALLLGSAGLPPAARVLDACSAPGGKAAHLLELADLDLLALDQDPMRLQRVSETLSRLHLKADCIAADAAQPSTWWDGRPFDAILLDAPCSASGIVRRHPDVRWLRQPGDIAALARTQARLLDALWPLLKPGGRLLYVSCSVFKAEGQHQIDAFLQRLPAGEAIVDSASPGHLLPLPQNEDAALPQATAPTGDGFFYGLLVKR